MTICIERETDGTYTAYLKDCEPGYNIQGRGTTAHQALQDFCAVYQSMKKALEPDGFQDLDTDVIFSSSLA